MKAHLPAIVHGAALLVGSVADTLMEIPRVYKSIVAALLLIGLGIAGDHFLRRSHDAVHTAEANADSVAAFSAAIDSGRRDRDSLHLHVRALETWRRIHVDTVARPTLQRLKTLEETASDLRESLQSIRASEYLYAKRQDSILARTGRIDAMLRRLLCRSDNRSANSCELQELGAGAPLHAQARPDSR